MVKIEKIQTEKGYTFKITTEEGTFSISFCGNLDLYFNYECDKCILDEPSSKKFIITKENYFLYSIFDKLFEDVKNCNIYYMDDDENLELEDDDIFSVCNREELNNELRIREESNPRRLFKNNKVEWHSDDYDYDETSVLTIEKLEEEIEIVFNKGRTDVIPETFAIRICNSGSRHQPFNVLFMHLYHKLIEYNPEFHQIHIEELLYEMKRVRKKES